MHDNSITYDINKAYIGAVLNILKLLDTVLLYENSILNAYLAVAICGRISHPEPLLQGSLLALNQPRGGD